MQIQVIDKKAPPRKLSQGKYRMKSKMRKLQYRKNNNRV